MTNNSIKYIITNPYPTNAWLKKRVWGTCGVSKK